MIKSNRPDDLKEWADYYLAIGFEKITIYDNESTFSVKDLFADYKNIEVKIVKSDIDFTTYAQNLYTATCNEKKEQTEWIAFFDDDEYLYLKNNRNIYEILDENLLSQSFYWKFLSSNIVLDHRDFTAIDTFNYNSLFTPCNNQAHVKTMINLNKNSNIKWSSVHLPTINGKKRSHDINKKEINRESMPINNTFYDSQSAILYHYFHKSYEDWLFKVKRNPTYTNSREKFEQEIIGKYIILDNSMIEKKKELGI